MSVHLDHIDVLINLGCFLCSRKRIFWKMYLLRLSNYCCPFLLCSFCINLEEFRDSQDDK